MQARRARGGAVPCFSRGNELLAVSACAVVSTLHSSHDGQLRSTMASSTRDGSRLERPRVIIYRESPGATTGFCASARVP